MNGFDALIAPYYGLLQLIHLLCAIIFAGAVFFEVLVIEPLEKRLPEGLGDLLAEEIPRRVRYFMPIVVGLLFLTGGLMFWHQFSSRPEFFHTRFGILLSVKVLLALAVLGVFVTSLRAALTGQMDVCRFRYTHRIVAALMLGIIILAKAMFYL